MQLERDLCMRRRQLHSPHLTDDLVFVGVDIDSAIPHGPTRSGPCHDVQVFEDTDMAERRVERTRQDHHPEQHRHRHRPAQEPEGVCL